LAHQIQAFDKKFPNIHCNICCKTVALAFCPIELPADERTTATAIPIENKTLLTLTDTAELLAEQARIIARLAEITAILSSNSLPTEEHQPPQDIKKTKSRPTKKEMADRNRSVALSAMKFHNEHGRLPTVDDIMEATSYNQKQIYHTDAYREGKIAKSSAKASDAIAGKSITSSEQFGEKSIEHTRANNRSKAEQAMLDALIETQKDDDDSNYIQ